MDIKHQPIPQNAGEPPVDDPAFMATVTAGHETTDVNVKGIFLFALALIFSVAVFLVGIAVVFKGFGFLNGKLDARRPMQEPGAASQVKIAPDYQGPLLQVKPEEDLRGMRVGNATDLRTYTWIDRQAGVVRLPVDRAMDLLAERGVPPVSPGKTLEGLQRERARPQVFGQSLRP